MLSIYKASAGSGKTFVLAREYIKFILGRKTESGAYVLETRQGERHRHILAITFTNKATEEMKRRIIHQLAVLGGMEPNWIHKSPYLDYFTDTFGCTEEALRKAAAEALRGLLFDLGGVNISTIDSFFQSVLRSFAREAEVNGNYGVEIDQEEVIEESVDRMMDLINRPNPTADTIWLINWLEKYMLAQVEHGQQFAILNRSLSVHKSLIKLISHLTNDTFRENEAVILGYLREPGKLEKFIYWLGQHETLGRQLNKKLALRALDLLDAHASNPGLSDTLYRALKNWSITGLYIDRNKNVDVPKTVRGYLDNPSGMVPKKNAKILRLSADQEAAVLDFISQVTGFVDERVYLQLLRENLYQLGMMRPLADRLNDYRHEHQAILLSDTNKIINAIIGNTDSPFLYERIGTRYEHYLIDEFQDTSLSQWQNLRPLISETDANNHDSLIIGDVKQSIYRFRDSDSSLLAGLHNDFPDCDLHGDTPDENTNWRSARDVVTFNNTFFRELAGATGFSGIYANVEQQVSPKHLKHGGYVEISVFDSNAKDDDGGTYKEQVVDYMALRLRRQLEAGYSPDDIAFLVRTRSEGEKIIRRLRQLQAADPTWPQFRIVSDKSLIIENVPSVACIISTIRLLSASDAKPGKKALTEREKAVFINKFETTLSDCANPSEALLAAVDTSRRIRAGETEVTMPELPAMTDHDMISLVEALIRSLSDDERRRDALALSTLQDMIATFVSRGLSDLRAFLEWWDIKGRNTSIPTAKDEGAINVLTIHKSKGLEWKCVFVPYADFYVANHTDTNWFDIRGTLPQIPADIVPPFVPLSIKSDLEKTPLAQEYLQYKRDQLSDDLNLLYVAFTRATDELLVGIQAKPETEIGKVGVSVYPSIPCLLPEMKVEDIVVEKASDTDSDGEPSEEVVGKVYTLGAPTLPGKKAEEASTAIEPGSADVLDGYPVVTDRNMWAGTELQLERFNHIDIARERGLIIHEIMAGIRSRTDVDEALRVFRLTPDGVNMSARDFEAISELIRLRVDNPAVRQWFEGTRTVYMERGIAVGGIQPRRFDRLVWTAEGEIHIVDYKTGYQEPRKYRRQMREYVKYISMLYDEPVRAFLYYLDTGRVVEMK